MKSTRVTVRFSADLRRRLKSAACRAGTIESDLIRRAVERELAGADEAPTACELFKKAGLIGIVREGPSDLSTNPDHFEGFGALE
jgi:predicted DNA-binding protein